MRWVENAIQLAQQHGNPVVVIDNVADQAADAQTVLDAISAGGVLLSEWPVHRVVPAAAYAAAAILHALDAIDRVGDVFTEG